MRTCEHCGAPLVRNPKHSERQWRELRFCGKPCAGAASRKDRPCACGCGEQARVGRKFIKGHRPIRPTLDGYRRVWVGKGHPLASADGNCFEHRLMLFNAGIAIPEGFHVHHRNGDKLDNRLANLAVIRATEHGRLHSPNTDKPCCVNGHAFDDANTYFDSKGWRHCRTCNRERQRRRLVGAVGDTRAVRAQVTA